MKNIDNLSNAIHELGCSVQELNKAISTFSSQVPRLCEKDITLVKNNPTIPWYKKILICRRIRRYINSKKL